MGYLRAVTHPRIFRRPPIPDVARGNIAALLACSNCWIPAENERFWPTFQALAEDGPLVGNLVPDAHVAGLMLTTGVRRICTRDRDFRKFDRLVIIDPFAANAATRVQEEAIPCAGATLQVRHRAFSPRLLQAKDGRQLREW